MELHEQRLHKYIKAFIIDRKSQNLSPGTIYFYNAKFKLFLDYCDLPPSQITPSILREFFIKLAENHTSGGVHCVFRALKTLFLFIESEGILEDWQSPLRKLKPPKLDTTPLNPISIEDLNKLLKVSGVRDFCIFICLADLGCRISELLSTDIKNIDLLTGEVLLLHTKGRKYRTAFLGKKSRIAIRKYLRTRTDDCEALFVTDDGHRLTYLGLRSIIYRRSKEANIDPPPPHSFRRFFALSMVRSGCSIENLRILLGHKSYSCLQVYLKESNLDIQLAHRQGGVDKWLG